MRGLKFFNIIIIFYYFREILFNKNTLNTNIKATKETKVKLLKGQPLGSYLRMLFKLFINYFNFTKDLK